MQDFDREFSMRAGCLPVHGVGLSVDVFTPDLLQLQGTLTARGLAPDYLEVFKAPTRELSRIRAGLTGMRLAYHAEGLWLIDPLLRTDFPWTEEIETIARHANTLCAAWVNHECATKQLGGHSVGTYLPPVFTTSVANVTARNAGLAQQALDERAEREGVAHAPLLLLELPPLSYFAFGDMPVAEFFRLLTDASACGLVLDIGHLWTIWRYCVRRGGVSIEAFVEEFLQVFPLHRVIQIHVAGLAAATGGDPNVDPTWPMWLDAHAAPVPPVLWRLLRIVLADPRLTSLKGVALEVDTKEIPLIADEFDALRRLCADVSLKCSIASTRVPASSRTTVRVTSSPSADSASVESLYRAYARVLMRQEAPDDGLLAPYSESLNREGLRRYTGEYLPHELLHWGGDLEELFPKVWETLRARGLASRDFVRFWFEDRQPVTEPYDFFSIKLDRWAAFIRSVAPDLAEDVEREVGPLREGHALLNREGTLKGVA